MQVHKQGDFKNNSNVKHDEWDANSTKELIKWKRQFMWNYILWEDFCDSVFFLVIDTNNPMSSVVVLKV
jgi:hypothetical protein